MKGKTLFIGDNCQLGDSSYTVALNKMYIGNNVLLASNVFISDCDNGSYKGQAIASPNIIPSHRVLIKGETYIGDNVWIDENTVILMGSKIDSECVIGANAVIMKSIHKNSIVVGKNKIIQEY